MQLHLPVLVPTLLGQLTCIPSLRSFWPLELPKEHETQSPFVYSLLNLTTHHPSIIKTVEEAVMRIIGAAPFADTSPGPPRTRVRTEHYVMELLLDLYDITGEDRWLRA